MNERERLKKNNRKMWYVTDSCCHVTGGVKNLVVHIRNAREYHRRSQRVCHARISSGSWTGTYRPLWSVSAFLDHVSWLIRPGCRSGSKRGGCNDGAV